ncbi:MAG: efflux RND transporter permease subunit [Leptospiraceae bacterium]|nr:efflux RND transporter permease subunit [Leptospiraceae bacterium]
MKLSDISIRRPVFAWMIMFSLIIFGAVSLGRLGISYMPDVDFPLLSIRVSWEGVAPEYMETEIVDRVEKEVIAVEGLKEIISSVRQGSANIQLEFDIDRDIDVAVQEVQTALSQLRLPTGVDPPVLRKNNPDESPILWLGLSGNRSQFELFRLADQLVLDRIQLVDGVGEVFVGGSAERNLRIYVDNRKLNEYELTILDVRNAIRQDHVEGSSGYLENEQNSYNLRTMGEASSIDQMERIRITRRGGGPIYLSDITLGDVATIENGLNDAQRINRVNGVEAITIGVKKQTGANEVQVAENLRAEIERINRNLPDGVALNVNFDGTRFTKEAIEETQFTLILSAVLTALVCFVFLGNWSSTFNVILSIPTSIVGTFIIIYFMGFTLNLFTLLALSLAIGIVVDDNIMILENIVRHFEMGKDRVRAARDGARQITFAAVAASVAIVAIFLPVAFMEGVIGKFFFQFGVTISAAVALSLLDAVTLTPMRASLTLVHQEREPRISRAVRRVMDGLGSLYRKALELTLARPYMTVLAAMAIFGLSLSILFFIRREFVPPQDQSQFGVRFETPMGSSIHHTDKMGKQIEAFLKQRAEVTNYLSIVGGFGGGEANTGVYFISLVGKSQRDIGQYEFMDLLRKEIKDIPGMRGFLFDFSSRGLSARRSQPVEFSIRGGNWHELKSIADAVLQEMEKSGLYEDPQMDYREGMPEVQVIPDRKEAALRGVTMESLVETVGIAMGGAREGRFTGDGRRYDIRLRLLKEQWSHPEDLNRLKVRNGYGELVNLPEVARVETKPTVLNLTRIDRQRAIQISANLKEGVGQADGMQRAETIARKHLKESYGYYPGGGSREFEEAFSSLALALWLGVLVAYMVLGAQFNSFLHPISVLMALPFSATGAFLALYVTGQSLNLYSMIGLILLMGISKKNSIMLVEFANELRKKEGLSVQEALIEAGLVRLRPIVMTSLSAIAAAIPPALAIGPGAESRIPMSIAVIGGMTVSTILTLIVVPAVYSILSRFERSR